MPDPSRRLRPCRDPRLPVADMFDPLIAQQLWDGLPAECRSDHFDKTNLPAGYASVVVERPTGRVATTKTAAGLVPSWVSSALNMRGLPEPMTQELAWLVHREAELGLRIYPNSFNGATLGLRMATRHGGPAGRSARSLLQLTPEEWSRQTDLARLHGQPLGISVNERMLYQLRRWQDELVYSYHRGEWWRLDVWNPLLDPRIPQRDHEPNGRNVLNFAHLSSPWLREAAKWLQRHITATSDDGPTLVSDADELRTFVRAFLERLRSYRISLGARAGQPLAGNPFRQLLVATEQFYAYMFDNRREAAGVLDEPRWLQLTSAHSVLFRPGDKPRFTNKKSDDMVLEDEVFAQIARGAELLVLPKAEGGLEDVSAFHALMLLIRTGRRINEVLLMDFQVTEDEVRVAPPAAAPGRTAAE